MGTQLPPQKGHSLLQFSVHVYCGQTAGWTKMPLGALLTQIFRRIIGSPYNKAAWLELMHFGPVILDKPKRGGSKRNLSNIVNSRTAAWDRDTVPTVHCQTTDSKASRKSSGSSRLAAAVSSKLEAGNFNTGTSKPGHARRSSSKASWTR